MTRINIHDPVYDICHRLRLEPENVARLDITPRSVTATVFKLNANGAKHLEPSYPHYVPATETKTFEVTTHKIETPA